MRIKIEAFALDSTSVKVHPDGTGALKKRTAGDRQVAGRMEHQDSYGCRECSNGHNLRSLAGQRARRAGGTGAALRTGADARKASAALLMDRAYEGDETRQLVLDLGMVPVVPPKSNRIEPWEYDRALYKKRNEIERLFRRLKGFRRIFSRFEKLDLVYFAFLYFALIVEALRLV